MLDDDQRPPPTGKHIRPKTKASRCVGRLPVEPFSVRDSLADNDGLTRQAPNSVNPPPKPKPAPTNGILRRNPKYSKPKNDGASTGSLDASVVQNRDTAVMNVGEQNDNEGPTPVVQDIVVEKPRPRKPNPNRIQSLRDDVSFQSKALGPLEANARIAAAGRVEGYEPRAHASASKGNCATATPIDANKDSIALKEHHALGKQPILPVKQYEVNHDSEEPLIFNSLADMMAMAGTLPDVDMATTQDPVMIEAELQFSCMDRDEFQQEQQSIFIGKHNIFDREDDEAEAEESATHRSLDTDDEVDDELLDVLGLGGSIESDDEEPSPAPRAFLQLWTAIAQWVTPEAAAFVAALQSSEPDQQLFTTTHAPPNRTRQQSDVALSRCAGLMAALRLHTARCWHLLNGKAEDLRKVETTLGDLLRHFDYSRPMPSALDLALTRALACVLLRTVAPSVSEIDPVVPAPCAALGMSQTEYSYLVCTAFVAFGSTSIDQ